MGEKKHQFFWCHPRVLGINGIVDVRPPKGLAFRQLSPFTLRRTWLYGGWSSPGQCPLFYSGVYRHREGKKGHTLSMRAFLGRYVKLTEKVCNVCFHFDISTLDQRWPLYNEHHSKKRGLFVFSLCVLSRFSCIQLFATLWAVAHQAPLSVGFPKKEYWSGLPFPSPGDLPHPGIEPMSPETPALAGWVFTTEPPGKPKIYYPVHSIFLISREESGDCPLDFICDETAIQPLCSVSRGGGLEPKP